MAQKTLIRRMEPSNLDRSGGRKPSIEGINAWPWLWVAILFWLVGVYMLVNFRLPKVLTGSFNIYLAQPLTWSSLALLGYLGWRFGLQDRPKTDRHLVVMGILSGLFQIAVFIIAGLLLGFGHSPYSHKLLYVLGNMLYMVTMLIGVEMSRAYLVGAFSLGNRTLAVVTPSLLLASLGIPIAKYTSIVDPLSLFKFIGVTYLPAFSEHLLASFLALLGGPGGAIAYRGILQIFEWLSPVLPNLQWPVTAFLGTMAPAFGLIVIRNQILPETTTKGDVQQRDVRSSTAWVMVVATAVTLLWFNTGLFGIRPTLISGVSMSPALVAGDVVITRDVSPEEVEVGDIIRFQHGGSYIIHRVAEIEKESGRVYFVTQGDANNVQDPPLLEGQLEGKVILVVPKVGWLSIGVRRLIDLIL